MSDWFALGLVNLGCAAIGWLVLDVVRGSWTRVEQLALALVVGLATFGSVATFAALVELAPTTGLLAATLGLAVLGWLAVRTRRGRPARTASRPLDVVEGVLLLATVALCALQTVVLSLRPLRDWDAWAIWAPKAHALVVEGGASSDVLSCATCGWSHPDYPLFVPSLEALVLQSTGGFDARAFDTELGVLLLAFGLALWALARRAAPGWLAALSALAIVSAVSVVGALATGYADVPLALLVALGVVSLALWLRSGEGALLLTAAIALAAAALTKNEGQLFAVLALGAALPIAPTAGRRVRPLLLAGAGVAAVIIAWRLRVAAAGIETEVFRFSSLLEPDSLWQSRGRFTTASTRLAGEAAAGEAVNAVILLAAACAATASCVVRRYAEPAFLLLWTSLSVGFLGLLYWISVWELEAHLDTSAERVVTSIVLSAAALTPVLLGPVADALRRPDV